MRIYPNRLPARHIPLTILQSVAASMRPVQLKCSLLAIGLSTTYSVTQAQDQSNFYGNHLAYETAYESDYEALTRSEAVLLTNSVAQPKLPKPPQSPFRIDGKPPIVGLVTSSAHIIDAEYLDSPMLCDLLGVQHRIDIKKFSSLKRATRLIELDESQRAKIESNTTVAYLQFQRKQSAFSYSLKEYDKKNYILQSVSNPDLTWTIQRRALELAGFTPTQSNAGLITTQENRSEDHHASSPIPTQGEYELPQPYLESPIELNAKTIRQRMKLIYPKLTRTPSEELYRVRLPRNYDPKRPAGVLLWISASPDGSIHRTLHHAADQLGLICIGIDNNGNKRTTTDRLQNHLDSIETLAQHHRIDRERIYVTGVSGGGRCAGILQLAFPDIFAGAVPIIGMDSYHRAPTGDQGKYWPQKLAKPASRWMKLLKERRIAAITGSVDFNEPEMSVRHQLMKRDGLQSRLDVIEGMGHTMPTAAQFADCLNWVDEPRRDQIEHDLQLAKDILSKLSNIPDEDLQAAHRHELVEITVLAPWSEEAMTAAKRLGVIQDS